MWIFGLPFNGLAEHERPSALHIRVRVCANELFHVPHNNDLEQCNLRPQYDRVYVDRNARFPIADALHFLPREQQLHVELSGLLRMPHPGLAKHHHTGRHDPESYYFGVPARLLYLPLHNQLDQFKFQSQQYALPVDRGAHDRGLQSLPHQFGSAANRLLHMPHSSMAEHHYAGWVSTESYYCRVSNHLRDVPHDSLLVGREL
jgi:hypothetical protein